MPKVSFASKIINLIITIKGSKKVFSSKKEALLHLEKQREEHKTPYHLPRSFKRFFKERKIEGTTCLIKSGNSLKHIVYLHGGGYTNQPSKIHLAFLTIIQKETDANILVPIYPKAPDSDFTECYSQLFKVVQKTYENQTDKELIFMGDSAGGALALGLSMYLKKKKMKQPSKIVLLSPYLDLMLENEEIKSVESKDKMLGVIGCREIGKSWARNADPNNYLLSPINGDLQGIGKVFIVSGTYDILWPDVKRFVKRAKQEKVSLVYKEYIGMQHVFALQPIPEAKKAISQIVEFILN